MVVSGGCFPRVFLRMFVWCFGLGVGGGGFPSSDFGFWILATREKNMADGLTGCGTRFVDLVQDFEMMAGYYNLVFRQGVPG
ncbi:hypothetical protein BDU57DRAFT_508565 [Ampelomyces quisqualis]|uniref:Uncharacterized protein n=1 Tax=Ampelomyces quisqualis TaxID=50730 RepID=A0A6A5QZN2_AMPQU|nr:hypothetical protein BDU57DRAFT_508565 [Ampelomyces quisqualis]